MICADQTITFGCSPGFSFTQTTWPSSVRMNISGQRNFSVYFSASSSLMLAMLVLRRASDAEPAVIAPVATTLPLTENEPSQVIVPEVHSISLEV